MTYFSIGELLLLFIIGGVIGFFAETAYCLVINRRYESRKGLVYGPFSQVYGLGAVLLTVVLYPISQRSILLLFVFSALIGGVFEAICSVFQEKAFGTVSWEYSRSRLSLLGGRTHLVYMVFWGVMGCAYIRFIHPALFSLIGMIPEQIKAPLVFAVSVFLAYDMILSALAVKRWQARKRGAAAVGRLDAMLDARFPNARMEKIYANMTTVEAEKSTDQAKEPEKTGTAA